MADKEKPEIPNNFATRNAARLLEFTDKLNRRKFRKDPEEAVYADITNRMFALAFDMLILVAPLTILTNIVIAVFLSQYQYDLTIAKIHETAPPEVFAALSKDIFAMNRYIAANYPSDAVTILHQLIFVRTSQLIMLGIYIIFFTWKFGATPGKMFLGIKVVDKITGGKLSLSQSAIRFLSYFITVPFGLMYGAFRRDKRCWHDFVADTVVIFTPNRWYKRIFLFIGSKLKSFLNIK